MHNFKGRWITNEIFENLKPVNVFHRQLEPIEIPKEQNLNKHILFRRKFNLDKTPESAKIFITADDYYKLYINGKFVCQGPTQSYITDYAYNEVDVSEFLKEGENLIAVHTLYQGLINRVFISGDSRHGLLLDLEVDNEIILSSDESFLTKIHGGYIQTAIVGIQTQFMEDYDSNCSEVGFEKPDFNDSLWKNARLYKYSDHKVVPQRTKQLVFEKVSPVKTEKQGNTYIYDFGSCYAAYFVACAKGEKGSRIRVLCGQELNEDGSVRYILRAHCTYEENWILSGGEDVLDWFDYKAFRYVALEIPEGCEILDSYLIVRHYPFELTAELKADYGKNPDLKRIWDLCVNSQKYGVQEAVYDCMDREKGFYLGDGCYSVLANMILTSKDDHARKMIDDAFKTTFISDSLMTCLDCAFMQEIGEYPLMLIPFLLWHYRLTGDKEYLAQNYEKSMGVIEAYRRQYEKDGLLCNVDKWCVVDWPMIYRDGYDVDLTEGQVCREPHISLNSYYINAIRHMNKIAEIIGKEPYRDEAPLYDAYIKAFYDKERKIFTDSDISNHVSYIGNIFPFAFGLCPDKESEKNIIDMIKKRGISSVAFFGGFLLLYAFALREDEEMIKELLLDEGAWLRMLREGATTTFESWGKDMKQNASLFHMTYSDAAIFMADIDLKKIFE